jgi:hypothetical protein
MSLTQFTPTTWPIPAANQIPSGSTINNVTLSVTHSESNTSQTAAPTVNVSCGAVNLPEHTASTADPVDVTSCLNTPAKLNAGVSALFSASRNSNSPTVTLSGMSLSVTYTPPADVGSLTPASGCITQVPYYGPNHEPAYNGACALFSVASNANGGTAPRVAVFWGTVYAPSAALDVPVDVLSVPVFDRGVVARMLMLGYNVASNAQVPISSTPITANVPNNREVTFTACIGPCGAPTGSTKLEADVVFCDSTFDPRCTGTAAGGVKVQSWKVTR